MKKFLKSYENPNEKRINFGILNKTYDDSIINYIVESCKSLEVLKYIKFIGYKVNDDESNIDYNNYIATRKKKRGEENSKYLMVEDSRYGEIILKFEIECKGLRKKITKKILFPKPDENGYYLIKGKKYFLLYQLVDNSTYTTKNNLTLKSLMPVSLKRDVKTYEDIHKNSYTAPLYVVYVFRKEVDVILFYFVKFGMKKTLEYFSVNRIVSFVDKPDDTRKNIYFQINSKMLLEVNRHFFLKYQYVKSICFMILNVLSNRANFTILEDNDYWVEKIGSIFSTNIYNFYEKGSNTMTFFDRMLDETTKKVLKIRKENKRSIYSVIRWMIQNYNELKKKDNMDRYGSCL